MLADQLDYIVGVDPHRDSHALAVVEVVSGAVVFEATVAASSEGYANALGLAEEHARGRRAFAIEGTGSFGAGLTRFLTGCGEWVLEVGCLRRERRRGGKSDALDAIRAARSVLASERPATARAGGERQALQALVAAAVNAKRAGLCQLRDLLITAPEPLRSELRQLSRTRLLQRLAATRPDGRRDPELRGSAGLPHAHVHSIRAAFAVRFLETHPGDLEALQPLMGHDRLETTAVYLRRLNRVRAMERVRDLSWRSVFPPQAVEAHTGLEHPCKS